MEEKGRVEEEGGNDVKARGEGSDTANNVKRCQQGKGPRRWVHLYATEGGSGAERAGVRGRGMHRERGREDADGSVRAGMRFDSEDGAGRDSQALHRCVGRSPFT